MASLITRPNSPFWYLQYKKDGKWHKASTGLLCDCPNDTAKARTLRAEFEAKEFTVTAAKLNDWEWVPTYFQTMGIAERSVDRYMGNWGWISLFLTNHKLMPGLVVYRHAEEYLHWRTTFKKKSGRTVSRNTAIMELKLLGCVLGECVRRGLISANPLSSIRFKKTPPAKKPELTDAEIETCMDALKREPEWMQRSFLIALHTGCRLRETIMQLSCIDLDHTPATMTWAAPKGGTKRSFSVPIPDALIPLFSAMKAAGENVTLTMPFQPSRQYQHFFHRVGLDHLTFHCLRVTKITRLRREGVPREVAMRLVNHSSELIHTLYDRHQVQDLMQYRNSGAPASFAAI